MVTFCLINSLSVFDDSDFWYGEICVQRSGVESGNLSNRCGKDEQLFGGEDGEQLVRIHIHASTLDCTPC